MDNYLCNKCGECCKKIAVDFERKIIYRDGVEPLTDDIASLLIPFEKRDNITFCRCKFLKNCLCTNSNKPDGCKKFPSSPFAFIPEDCGYLGDVFLRKEHVKQKVRRLKEEILSYEAQILLDKSEAENLGKIIAQHQAYINKFRIYGSYDW